MNFGAFKYKEREKTVLLFISIVKKKSTTQMLTKRKGRGAFDSWGSRETDQDTFDGGL